ncbi:hypothetical protein Tsubulata_014968 [Turnera subulata]|uniref:Uncharacterized protein n=1 Tax=Turnera subulata TaxID=218843 RepID=A0A9Q0F9G3_9ROSI|nr:hypothetical protein Tsubulata_014968 [Turnera subulata]
MTIFCTCCLRQVQPCSGSFADSEFICRSCGHCGKVLFFEANTQKRSKSRIYKRSKSTEKLRSKSKISKRSKSTQNGPGSSEELMMSMVMALSKGYGH